MINLIILHWRILRALIGSDAVFFWFADYYTLIPSVIARILGKKVFVVAGGFDVAYIPEVKSGARTRKGRWFMVRNTFRYAGKIFPVSYYALKMLNDAVPDHSPAVVIYNAVDTGKFTFHDGTRERMALTVTQLDTVLDYKLKGIDVFLKAAQAMPDVRFELVGIRSEALVHARNEAQGLPNVLIVEGPVSFETLLTYYHRAGAYCQLSMDESFGVAVAESMSCGVIPVVSRIPSLVEVTGETGFVVDRTQLQEITKAIEQALSLNTLHRQKARDHALMFDIARRREKLLAEVGG